MTFHTSNRCQPLSFHAAEVNTLYRNNQVTPRDINHKYENTL